MPVLELDSHSELASPYLLMDLHRLRENSALVRAVFAPVNAGVYYSVKANGHPGVLRALDDEGFGFDVASLGEIHRLVAIGVSPSRMIFSATVKVPSHIAGAFALGIDRFACDSPAELAKLAEHAPGSRIIVRIQVPHTGSRWPLAAKFGVPPREGLKLLGLARAAGLEPYGLTFHVGSQCLRPETWLEAIDICAELWQLAKSRGIQLRMLNLGGGFPATYTEDVPSLAEIGNEIVLRLARKFAGEDVEYAIEPGRFLVGDAGELVTTVIGKARRQRTDWVFVDLSIYAGLLEVAGGWTYETRTAKDDEPRRHVVLAGPTCDSTDILARNIKLPDLAVGDRIVLLTAGAYTIAYEQYNGFSFPEVVFSGATPAGSVGARASAPARNGHA